MVSILLTLSLLVALLVPMAAPAGAKSTNGISRVVSVTDNYVSTPGAALAELTIKEDDATGTDFRDTDRFRITLKDGVKWVDGLYYSTTATLPEKVRMLNGSDDTLYPLNISIKSETSMEIELSTTGPTINGNGFVEIITIPLYVDVNGVSGDITVTVENIDSAVTTGTYTFATSKSTKTSAAAESVKTIGKSGMGGLIRIDEVSFGALQGKQTLKLKLPGNFTWNSFTWGNIEYESSAPHVPIIRGNHISFGGGFSEWTDVNPDFGLPGEPEHLYKSNPTIVSVTGTSDQTLEITFNFSPASTTRGSIYIQTPIRAGSNAPFGDIEVSLSGGDFEDTDLLVAKYMNWGVDFSIKSVKDLSAGKLEDMATDTIKIEENISGSLVDGRDITITLPDWVKVTGVSGLNRSPNGLLPAGWVDSNVGVGKNIDGTSNEFDIRIEGTTSGTTNLGKIEFKLDITIEANKTGEIEAEISGAGIEKTSIVIANAIAPCSATIDQVGEVKIGVQSQDIPDIYITEEIKGAAKYRTASKGPGYITLTAPDGVRFASTPTAEVTEGNLTLKSGARLIKNRSDIADGAFQIPVDSDSTRPSTIKISNIKLTVDRTYPEGDIILAVGGSAFVENVDSQPAGWLNRAYATDPKADSSVFITGTVVRLKAANCVTPAPGEVVASDTVFTIGSTTYTVNGVEQTMDIAPYIKDDRTFIPLRFVARATGVSDENILFNQEYQTVTLIKGDRVVVTTIGSNILQVNGAAITMDTAPELVDPPGRTMFPIRWVATALGCNVDWDPDTQEVRIY